MTAGELRQIVRETFERALAEAGDPGMDTMGPARNWQDKMNRESPAVRNKMASAWDGMVAAMEDRAKELAADVETRREVAAEIAEVVGLDPKFAPLLSFTLEKLQGDAAALDYEGADFLAAAAKHDAEVAGRPAPVAKPYDPGYREPGGVGSTVGSMRQRTGD